jgi:hypothetical protein
VQFVHQIVNEQIVPEQAAQEYQDVFAGLLFERGKLLVRIRPFDDARIFRGANSAAVRLSEITIFSMEFMSPAISCLTAVALGSVATSGQKPLLPKNAVRLNNRKSAVRNRSAL